MIFDRIAKFANNLPATSALIVIALLGGIVLLPGVAIAVFLYWAMTA